MTGLSANDTGLSGDPCAEVPARAEVPSPAPANPTDFLIQVLAGQHSYPNNPHLQVPNVHLRPPRRRHPRPEVIP